MTRVSLPARVFARFAVLALALAGFSSCSGGGIGLPPLRVLAFNFSPGFGGVHLNAPLEMTFSAPVDGSTVTQDSIRIFTTTTTVEQPDPGAPAIGTYMTNGNVVTFLPRIPQLANLSDAGLRIGFTYTIQVPASPDVIEPVRTIENDPNVVNFTEFFTTLNSTILPAPGDITAEPNLATLSQFFIDEFDETNSLGVDPCPRNTLPAADRDSPQVIDTDPDEGESGFGTITGIQPGLGTAFVRLDPITLLFSEPISPWRIRPQNISIKNANLGGETFDLFFFFSQDRSDVRLQITVFDKDSAFDQASVPQGRYVLSLTQFTDLAGNPLVNAQSCVANGTFDLSFSTVSSPTLPTDLKLTFQDDDLDGHVDYGGLATAVNNPNVLPEHVAPFLGGFSTDQVMFPSPSNQVSNANWGNTMMWTGFEARYDNGYDPDDAAANIPNAMRLRGGSFTGATAVMAPIAGRATGPSHPAGSADGSIPAASGEPGKVDFFLSGPFTAQLFTGNATTGPIVYHYNRFDLLEDSAGNKATLTYRKLDHNDSVYPMVIFVEDEAVISGIVDVDGRDGSYGFNGDNSGIDLGRNPGGLGGFAGPGGGRGGDGGVSTLGPDPTLLNGQNGGVPWNVIGPLDDLSEAVAGLTNMSTGGGGHFDHTQEKCPSGATEVAVIPAYCGGGGGGCYSSGTDGGDLDAVTPGETDHGRAGQRIGTVDDGFGEAGILATGGAGGGGGGADDDGGTVGSLNNICDDGLAGLHDDGGGGGGGGAGFFGLACAGNIALGVFDDNGTPGDTSDDVFRRAIVRAVGGRGGSTYAVVSGTPPAPASPSDAIGQGEAGGGGGGGGICLISGGDIDLVAAELYAFGKLGGNDLNEEGGGRVIQDRGGNGGGGKLYLSDSDGNIPTLNPTEFFLIPGPGALVTDGSQFTGTMRVSSSTWGDDPREVMYGTSRIVSEFFDTLSDSTSYDGVRVLSNAPRFPYSVGTPTMRTIRVFVDAATTGAGGFPDLTSEDPLGNFTLDPTKGFTHEIGLHFNAFAPVNPGDPAVGDDLMTPQWESFEILPAGAQSQGKRYVRMRILFDLALVGTPTQLLNSFAPAGAPSRPIADADDADRNPLDPPGTYPSGLDYRPGPENTLGNTDTAPDGVPAVAEARVTFTP